MKHHAKIKSPEGHEDAKKFVTEKLPRIYTRKRRASEIFQHVTTSLQNILTHPGPQIIQIGRKRLCFWPKTLFFELQVQKKV